LADGRDKCVIAADEYERDHLFRVPVQQSGSRLADGDQLYSAERCGSFSEYNLLLASARLYVVGNRDHTKRPILTAMVLYHTINSFAPGSGAEFTDERSDRDLNRANL
jgi:hypothetical protein